MQMCNTEIIKKIKEFESKKSEILSFESRNRRISYQNESDKIVPDYNFLDTRHYVKFLNVEIRKLKHLLSYSNATTLVDGFDMTIGECLVYMAQLNAEKSILESMYNANAKSRQSSYGGAVEFTELTYDIFDCKEYLDNIKDIITKLQIAIDRTNLNNMIEVD